MEELSKLLKIPEEDIKKVLANIPANYHRFIIRQKKKTREITEPSKELKRIQNAINYRLLYKKSAHPIAHAFVTGKSPKTNAAAHMGANSVYVTDIKNFFPSIRAGKVKVMLDSVFPHLSEETTGLIALLTTLNGTLPQGAPTSPTISNLVMLQFDADLRNQIPPEFTVTRYCDDITVSTVEKKHPFRTSGIARIISITLFKHRFRENERKIRIMYHYRRMKITGIVINEKLNIERKRWRNLRAELHNINQLTNEQIKSIKMSQRFLNLRGRIEWIRSINPNRGKQLLNEYMKILKKV